MTNDRWLEIKDLVKEKFSLEDEGEDSYEEQGGMVIQWLEFDGPLGLMRLEYETKPVILDKKAHGSNRMGSTAAVQYIYSDTEKTSKMYAYRYDEAQDTWQEIDLSQISFK